MRVLLAVVLVLGVAACGSSGARIAKSKLPSLVISSSDLGKRYSEFVNRRQLPIDAHEGPRSDVRRFHRIDGWVARYRLLTRTVHVRGPIVVESRADLFASIGDAKRDLDAYAEEYRTLTTTAGGKQLDAPTIGDGARAFTFGSASDIFYVVAWREANATASVVVEGSRVGLRDAVALARKQQRRLVAAAR